MFILKASMRGSDECLGDHKSRELVVFYRQNEAIVSNPHRARFQPVAVHADHLRVVVLARVAISDDVEHFFRRHSTARKEGLKRRKAEEIDSPKITERYVILSLKIFIFFDAFYVDFEFWGARVTEETTVSSVGRN